MAASGDVTTEIHDLIAQETATDLFESLPYVTPLGIYGEEV